MIQLFPCHSPRPWPPLVTAPWGRIFQQHWCLQTPVLLPWLALLYPCCPWEQGREMLHVTCYLHFSSCSLHIWTDCTQVTCSQLSWGVWTNLSFCHHLFLAYSPPSRPCALCFKTAQFLLTLSFAFWNSVSFWCKAGLTAFVCNLPHVYSCYNYYNQPCYCHIHCNVVPSQFAKPEPRTMI